MAESGVDPAVNELMTAAFDARARAYCPYSKFRVGASLLTPGGAIYTGVNVENVSYGLTLCAERVAAVNAVNAGHTKFSAMAVCCDIKNEFKASCGACRQFLVEFGQDLDVYLVKPDRSWKKINLKDLLPMVFLPDSLEKDRDFQDAYEPCLQEDMMQAFKKYHIKLTPDTRYQDAEMGQQ